MTTLPYTPACPHRILDHGTVAVWIGHIWAAASSRKDRVAHMKSLEGLYQRAQARGSDTFSAEPTCEPGFIVDPDTVHQWRADCIRLNTSVHKPEWKSYLSVEVFTVEAGWTHAKFWTYKTTEEAQKGSIGLVGPLNDMGSPEELRALCDRAAAARAR